MAPLLARSSAPGDVTSGEISDDEEDPAPTLTSTEMLSPTGSDVNGVPALAATATLLLPFLPLTGLGLAVRLLLLLMRLAGSLGLAVRVPLDPPPGPPGLGLLVRLVPNVGSCGLGLFVRLPGSFGLVLVLVVVVERLAQLVEEEEDLVVAESLAALMLPDLLSVELARLRADLLLSLKDARLSEPLSVELLRLAAARTLPVSFTLGALMMTAVSAFSATSSLTTGFVSWVSTASGTTFTVGLGSVSLMELTVPPVAGVLREVSGVTEEGITLVLTSTVTSFDVGLAVRVFLESDDCAFFFRLFARGLTYTE